jgi:hypothetical protein
MRYGAGIGIVTSMAVLIGCSEGGPAWGEEPGSPAAETAVEWEAASVAAAPEPPRVLSAADSAEARARLEAEAESLRAVFAGGRELTAREVAELRLDRNATQIATARRLGTRVSGQAQVERLLASGALVELEDSTEYWILRRMENSMAYATPDLNGMLEELGRRFHARLDELGLPRYRMRVTSVLRTPEDQEVLRRTNPNASRIVSAHEFGTTVDVSHERFAVPRAPLGITGLERLEVEMLEEVGMEHSRVLQAELGRAIQELRGEGALHVMMEDAQPVYHMTVARPYPRGGPDPMADVGAGAASRMATPGMEEARGTIGSH